MSTVSEIGVFESKTHLSEILERVERGERFYITKRGRRVAELRPVEPEQKKLTLGCARNDEFWMAPDFDEPLEDFEEYM